MGSDRLSGDSVGVSGLGARDLGGACTLMGVCRVEQLSGNVAVLELTLSAEHRGELDAASALATNL